MSPHVHLKFTLYKDVQCTQTFNEVVYLTDYSFDELSDWKNLVKIGCQQIARIASENGYIINREDNADYYSWSLVNFDRISMEFHKTEPKFNGSGFFIKGLDTFDKSQPNSYQKEEAAFLQSMLFESFMTV